MENSTLDSSSMIREKVKVHSYGPMVANTSANGKRVNNMALAPTSARKELRNKVSGRMVVKLDGSMKPERTSSKMAVIIKRRTDMVIA